MKKDYCTGWPDEIDGRDFSECCEKHDEVYAKGGFLNKFKGDYDLAKCVWNKADGNWYVKWNAIKMYLGVSTFGWIFWIKCRFEK